MGPLPTGAAVAARRAALFARCALGWLSLAASTSGVAAQEPLVRVAAAPASERPMVLPEWRSPGKFAVGDDHTSDDVELEVGSEVIWLETEHFRIGSTLSSRPLPPSSRERKPVYAECALLADRWPAVPKRPRSLPAWLQVYLLAQRLEATFDRVEQLLAADDDWWFVHRGEQPRRASAFLGSSERIVVLVFEDRGALARYLRRFRGLSGPSRERPWAGSWPSGRRTIATAVGVDPERLVDPGMLHGHLVQLLAGVLLGAIAGDDDAVPTWLQVGLGHWLVRASDPRTVDRQGLDPRFVVAPRDWPERLGGRLRHGLLPDLEQVLCWRDATALDDPVQHAVAWSLVDCIARDDGDLGRLLRRLREHRRTRWMPDSLLLRWQDQVLRASLGRDLDALQAAWHRHVADLH